VDGQPVKESVNGIELLDITGYKIGIFHGHGQGKSMPERAYDRFKDELYQEQGFMLNPGSPTNKRKERWYSFLLLELSEKEIHAQLKFYLP